MQNAQTIEWFHPSHLPHDVFVVLFGVHGDIRCVGKVRQTASSYCSVLSSESFLKLLFHSRFNDKALPSIKNGVADLNAILRRDATIIIQLTRLDMLNDWVYCNRLLRRAICCGYPVIAADYLKRIPTLLQDKSMDNDLGELLYEATKKNYLGVAEVLVNDLHVIPNNVTAGKYGESFEKFVVKLGDIEMITLLFPRNIAENLQLFVGLIKSKNQRSIISLMERGFVNKEWFKFEKPTAQSPDNPIALAVLFGLADVVKYALSNFQVTLSPTIILHAISSGSLETLKIVSNFFNFDHGTETYNKKNRRYNTFLFNAGYGHVSIARWLLAQSPELLNTRNECGQNALHLAAKNGRGQLVEFLASQQIEFCTDAAGQDPIDLAVQSAPSCLPDLVRALRLDTSRYVCQLLAAYRRKPLLHYRYIVPFPYHTAVKHLLPWTRDLNCVDPDTLFTPLLHCFCVHDYELLAILTALAAERNQELDYRVISREGRNCLHYLVDPRRYCLGNVLLPRFEECIFNGADANLLLLNGDSCIDIILKNYCCYDQTFDKLTSFRFFLGRGDVSFIQPERHVESILWLLLEKKYVCLQL